MQFFHPIWKNLHLTEIFYTGTACDASDKLKISIMDQAVAQTNITSLFTSFQQHQKVSQLLL